MWYVFVAILTATVCYGQKPLQNDVIPLSYDLKLNLSDGLESSFYTGTVKIILNVTQRIDTFTLFSSDLQILKTSLIYLLDVGEMSYPHTISVDESSGTMTVTSTGKLNPGFDLYALTVDFIGRFQEDLSGFYKTHYQSNGELKWMASTQFQPSSARKSFPCFDQPNFRSKLLLQIILPEELHCVANMPLANSSSLGENEKLVIFEETPAMPTYLFAWYVGDSTFDELDSFNSSGIRYGFHGQTSLKEDIKLVANYAPLVISALEEFTKISYTARGMTKLDQIAVTDFSAGAMENWGLVTYREETLLYNENASCALDKQRALKVMAHELSHQWFGDSVTLDWWSYAWLNEAFADYMEFVISNQIEPSWNLENQFLTDDILFSLQNDFDGHPLTNYNVSSEKDVDDMFDVITYQKGGSILRMFSSIVGETEFKKWLNIYLTSTIAAGSVATPDHLWAALPDRDLAEKFKSWTMISGHPIVYVIKLVSNSNTSLHFSQAKERMDGSHETINVYTPISVLIKQANNETTDDLFVPLNDEMQNDTNYLYSVTNSNDSVDLWLQNSNTLFHHIGAEPKWYLINNGGTGYYRVSYDEENWKALGEAINKSELTPQNRAILASDSINLAASGYLDPRVAFEFIRFLENERDLLVWKSAIMAFNRIRDAIIGEDIWYEFQVLVEDLINKADVFDSLMTEEPSHYESVLTIYLANQMCFYRPTVCNDVQNLHADMDSLDNLDRILGGAVFCQKVQVDDYIWENLYMMYLNSTVPNQKLRYLRSLLCTTNPSLQRRLLTDALDSKRYKKQDFNTIVSGICSTKSGLLTFLNFTRSRGSDIKKHLATKLRVQKMLSAVAKNLYNDKLEKEMATLVNGTVDFGLTENDKVELIASIRKRNEMRKMIASRICDGLNVPCVDRTEVPEDTVPEDDDSASTYALPSSLIILAALMFQLFLS